MQGQSSLHGRNGEPCEYRSKQQLAFPYLKFRFLEIPFEIRNSVKVDTNGSLRIYSEKSLYNRSDDEIRNLDDCQKPSPT
jgi:hypothetical protein